MPANIRPGLTSLRALLRDRPLTPEGAAARYCNFYEFSSFKSVWRNVERFQPLPWTLEVTGLVARPKTQSTVESAEARGGGVGVGDLLRCGGEVARRLGVDRRVEILLVHAEVAVGVGVAVPGRIVKVNCAAGNVAAPSDTVKLKPSGTAALLSMLQTCVPGLTVVNVDNGVGAGASAALIANRVAAARHEGESANGHRPSVS